MISIIDYGMGNLRSVQKALESVGAEAVVTSDPAVISKSDKVVLPGVGAFGDGMKGLQERGLVEPVLEAINAKKPFLGICLGLQLLFSGSEESGRVSGLGIIKGRVKRFPKGKLKIPHMGWDQLKIRNSPCPLLEGISDMGYMYFVHSYYVEPADKEVIAATTEYGRKFASVINKDNIWGTQFHPEKSQELGLKILRNFASLRGAPNIRGDEAI